MLGIGFRARCMHTRLEALNQVRVSSASISKALAPGRAVKEAVQPLHPVTRRQYSGEKTPADSSPGSPGREKWTLLASWRAPAELGARDSIVHHSQVGT